MHVLLVSTSSGSRGGGEIFLIYLAEALRQAGHETSLWCASHTRMDELAARFARYGTVYRDRYLNSYHDRRLRVFSAAFDIGTTRRLAARFSEIPCDIIHLNKQTLEDGLDLIEAVRLCGKPAVSTVHITQRNRELGAFAATPRDWLARRRLTRARSFSWTAVSDARANELRRFIPGDIHAIYNAVGAPPVCDRNSLRAGLLAQGNWPSDTLLAVCVARLVAQKNPSRFLRLAARLLRREPRYRFVWIGDGNLRDDFLKEAATLGLGDAIIVTGWTDAARDLLSTADLYLHPAAFEGLPLSILEAMSVGLPCVLSAAVAAEMEAFDRDSVIVADEEDGSTWLEAAAIPDRRQYHAEASRRLYHDYFRPEALAASVLRLYRSKLMP